MLKKHYTNSIFAAADSMFRSNNQRSGIKHLDSVYKTFPYISIADKCKYYLFRAQQDNIAASPDTVHANYSDSVITAIENNRLTEEMSGEYARALNFKAEFCLASGKYNEAIQAAALCRYVCEKSGNLCANADNEKIFGHIAYKQEKYIDAIEYYRKALLLSASCKPGRGQFCRYQKLLDNIGLSYQRAGNADSAVKYYRAGIAHILEDKKNSLSDSLYRYETLRNNYRHLASVFTELNKDDSTLLYLERAAAVSTKQLPDGTGAADTVFMASSLIRKKNMAQAAVLLDIITPAYGKLNADAAKQYLISMEQRYRAEKDPVRTIFYLTKLHSLKDSLDNIQKPAFREDPVLMYEQAEKKYHIESLEKNSRIQKAYIIICILIGLIFIWLCIMVYNGFRRSRSNAAQMDVMNRELQKREIALHKLMEGQERRKAKELTDGLHLQAMQLKIEYRAAILEQRQKIAADMHDELSNLLAALSYYVADIRDKADDEQSKAVLSELANEVTAIYKDARNYMHNLRAEKDGFRYDIVSFLHDITRKFREKKMISMHAEVDEEDLKERLTAEQHSQLYHIVRESISNIIKHAHATAVHIVIKLSDNRCRFEVADNGKGFEEQHIKKGLGLNSIRSRIASLGGDISFSTGNGGTKIFGSFPLGE